jgi:hypothetical protein
MSPVALVEAYSALRVPLDRLPYSEEMDRLVDSLKESQGELITHREAWASLLRLRKRRSLPKVGGVRRPRKKT